MAELASLYPTAGGLYFWAFRLGGRGWAFTTAWLNMVGQVTITAGIDIAAAIYLIGTATRLLGLPPDARLPVFGAVTSWSFQLFVMVLILVPRSPSTLRHTTHREASTISALVAHQPAARSS
jgi:amino acid transporter